MPEHTNRAAARNAILTFAQIKAVVDRFEAGELNLFEAIDAIANLAAAWEESRRRRAA